MEMEVKQMEIEIKPLDESFREIDEAAKAVKEGKHVEYSEKIVFPNLDLLRKILTPERIRMLRTIRKHKPSSIYQLAKLLGKDRRNVLKDLRYLHGMGLVKLKKEPKKRSPRGSLLPYVDFSRIVVGIPI